MSVLNKRKSPVKVLLLLLVLSLSLFVTGTCGALLVRKYNSSYQEIVTRELPILALLRNITRASSATRRAVNTYATTTDVELRAVNYKNFETALIFNDGNFERLKALVADDGKVALEELLQCRRNYIEAAKKVLFELEGRDSVMDVAQRQVLEELYGKYADSQDNLAEYAENKAAKKSERITVQGRRLYAFFLIVILWPVLISLGFFIYGILTTGYSLLRARQR
jgi:hypothetical protein